MSHAEAHDPAHGHDDHGHMPFLAHHFDDPEQQYDSGKLGMWLFLVTEVLFFSGMFCAYALYRSIHQEVFNKWEQLAQSMADALFIQGRQVGAPLGQRTDHLEQLVGRPARAGDLQRAHAGVRPPLTRSAQ